MRAGQVLGLQLQRVEDQPVDDPGAEALGDQQFRSRRPRGVVEQDGVVVLGGRVDDGAGELREVRVAQLGDGEGDDAGTAFAQVAGGEVRPVAEGVDGGCTFSRVAGVTCS